MRNRIASDIRAEDDLVEDAEPAEEDHPGEATALLDAGAIRVGQVGPVLLANQLALLQRVTEDAFDRRDDIVRLGGCQVDILGRTRFLRVPVVNQVDTDTVHPGLAVREGAGVQTHALLVGLESAVPYFTLRKLHQGLGVAKRLLQRATPDDENLKAFERLRVTTSSRKPFNP